MSLQGTFLSQTTTESIRLGGGMKVEMDLGGFKGRSGRVNMLKAHCMKLSNN